jgi:hypothetical protein
MPGGFAPRFAIEAGFLVLLGVGAGIADLRPVKIVAVLVAGWLLVSLVELAVWRAQSRPAAAFVPPPAEPAPEVEAEAEVEAEPVHGWPVDEEPSEADEAYPLRADAGEEPSGEGEAYTRVLESEREQSSEAER